MDGAPIHIVCPHCSAVNRISADRPAQQAKCGSCHQRLFVGKPVEVTTERFERHRTRDQIPLVVDFWAPWCGPCHAMAPAYERAAAELEPQYRLLKVNVDEEAALAEHYEIRSIPTMMLFARGDPIARTAGAMNTPGIVTWVRAQGEKSRADRAREPAK